MVLRPIDRIVDATYKPEYAQIDDLPLLESKGIHIQVIAGAASLNGESASSPIATSMPVMYLDMCLDAGKKSHPVEIPATFEGFVYVYGGSGYINSRKVVEGQAAIFGEPWPGSDGEGDEFAAYEVVRLTSSKDDELRAILIAGASLKEGDRYDSFVMKTRDAILIAVGMKKKEEISENEQGDAGTSESTKRHRKIGISAPQQYLNSLLQHYAFSVRQRRRAS